jgi:hypothetical protein
LSEPAEAIAKAGEFIGYSEMSLELQKQAIRSERRMPSTAESRLIPSIYLDNTRFQIYIEICIYADLVQEVTL